MSFPKEPGGFKEMWNSAEPTGCGSRKLLHRMNYCEIFNCLNHWLRQAWNYGVLKIATPELVPDASVSL